MNDQNIQQALEAIARRNVPGNTDLWPRIATRTGQKDVRLMKTRYTRLAWTLLLVVLGLAMVSTAAYALYRFFSDPGLDAVDEAGLASTMQVSAAPTILPAVTPVLPGAGQASMLAQSQTIDGVTLVLDWVYAENTGFTFGATLQNLPAGQGVGMPAIEFSPAAAQRYGEVLTALPQGNSTRLLYHASLVLNECSADGSIAAMVEIPLLSDGSDETGTRQVYRFELQSIPLYSGNLQGIYDYDVRSNGTSLLLESLHSDMQHTYAKVCFNPSSTDEGLSIRTAHLQYSSDVVPVASQNEVLQSQDIRPVPGHDGKQCVQLEFARGAGPADRSLRLEVNDLVGSGGETLGGMWRFGVSLPAALDIPGIAVPTPTPQATLLSQMAGGITATLEWAYADASRVAFQFHFEGWQSDFSTSMTTIYDISGNPLGYGYLQPVEGDAASFVMTFQPDDASLLQKDEISLQFDLPVYRIEDPTLLPPEQPLASFHFALDLPVYPAVTLEPAQETTANEISMKLVQVKASPSFTEVFLCFQKPTGGIPSDWGIEHSAVLMVGDRQSYFDSYTLLHDLDYGLDGSASLPGGAPPSGWRCVRLGFPLGHHNQAAVLELDIPALEIQFDGFVPPEKLQTIQEQLAQEGMAIEFYSVSGSGGGGGGFWVTQKPEGMEDEQVVQRLMEILGYSHAGPWHFTLEVESAGD